ncbi:MAG: prolyl oligopeptidase family serine peptidase [Dehalococcoidia bacterium]
MAQQLEKHHSSSLGNLDYLLFLPKDYPEDPSTLWPLMLFLHGRDESGDDLNIVKRHGLPKIIEEGEDFPCIAVSPQCPADTNWVDLTELLMALLNSITQQHRVDRQRIYLTGLSMGGRGAWSLAVKYPQVFAALAPICGRIPDVPQFMERVRLLKDVPIWVFHGAQDPVVPVQNSDSIVAALREVHGQVTYTVYPEAGHDSWTETYKNPDLYLWMLNQSLPGTSFAA